MHIVYYIRFNLQMAARRARRGRKHGPARRRGKGASTAAYTRRGRGKKFAPKLRRTVGKVRKWVKEHPDAIRKAKNTAKDIYNVGKKVAKQLV